MTVGELKRLLDQYADDHRVIFTPSEYCGEGYPEWESADVITERAVIAGKTYGGVTILLKDESE